MHNAAITNNSQKSTHTFSSLSIFLIHSFINSSLQFPSHPAHTTTGSAHSWTWIFVHTAIRSPFPKTKTDSLNHNSHQQLFIFFLTIQKCSSIYNNLDQTFLLYENRGFRTPSLPFYPLQCFHGFDLPQNPSTRLNLIKKYPNGPVSQLAGDPVPTYAPHVLMMMLDIKWLSLGAS